MTNAHNRDKNQENSSSSEEEPLEETVNQIEETEISPPVTVTIEEEELEQLRKDAAEYKDKSLRLLAEMDNARKRMQKEKHDLTQYAVQNVIIDFLNPIDHLENALQFTQQMSDEVKNWAFGFQMILNQFKDALASNGVVPFKSEGMPFDPHLHEAVEMVLTDQYSPGIVVEESIRGYKMGDRIIRPARVKVAKASTAEAKNKEEQSEQ